MAVRVRVTGHRANGRALDAETLRKKLEPLLPAFQEALAKAVREAVYETISTGRWHRSRNKRYDYHRSWVAYRYGASRRRPAGGGRGSRSPTNDGTRSNIQGLDLSGNQALDRMKFNFLMRALDKQAYASAGTRIVMGKSERRFNASGAAMSEVGIYDVTSALEKLKVIVADLKHYQALDQRDGTNKAAKHYQRDIEGFLYGAHDYNRFFRETRMGQRILRQAETAAMRHQRNTMILSADLEAQGAGPKDNIVRRQRRLAQQYAKSFGSMWRGEKKVPVVSSKGNYRYGFQTGTLAEAWARATVTRERLENRYRMTIAPHNQRDGRTPGPADLTRILKRQITKQGGDPKLLKRDQAREAIRSALRQVQADWAKQGIRGAFGS